MAKLIDPLYYEVQLTIISHDGTMAVERTFPKVKNLNGRQESDAKRSAFDLQFVAEIDESKGYHTLQKDLKIASRCHCYEDLQKEDK